jgi:multiple sugar transport system permease protein
MPSGVLASGAAMRSMAAPRRHRRRRGNWTAVLLILPSAIPLVLVTTYPIVQGFWLALRNTALATQENAFVGLDNFRALAADDLFWNAWRHTLVFTGISTLLETLIGLGMAIVLAEAFVGRSLVRAAMLVPWAMPTVVTSKMFGWLFDGQNGVVNWLLRSAGLISRNIDWYGSTHNAFGTIIAADVWKTAPFMALLLLAGLQTVPRALREAAMIDGAGAWQTFWYVRLPLLAPTMLIAGMFRALDAFRIFDLVYVLTGGGPADSTEVLSTLSYKTLFSALLFGYGSAISTAMFFTEVLLALGFGIFIVRNMRRQGN